MDVNVLERQFARIGARAQVRWLDGPRIRGSVALDIVRDRVGELFDILVSKDAPADVEVLHAEPGQRHLLLMSRSDTDEKHKFLCGHDERHWFVAAVPENRAVSTVRTAMEALKPVKVVGRQLRMKVRKKNWNRRRNEAFVRQGEWFFVPVPGFEPDLRLVLRREPLSRGNGSKPHLMELAFRRGGTMLYVSRDHPAGLLQADFDALDDDVRRRQSWRQMVRDAEVFAKGRISHPDHATLVLVPWHRVLMNTEPGARAMRHVAFLD